MPRWWTCGSKIGLADVLVPDAFVTAHVSFKAGDEDDEEEEEDWSSENERARKPLMKENGVTAVVSVQEGKKVGDQEKN